MANKLEPERFPDVKIPTMSEFVKRVATFRRRAVLTPALLAIEERGK